LEFIVMFASVIAALFLSALGNPCLLQDVQVQDVPKLDAAEVSRILIFEVEGLQEKDLAVERVEALHDRAKAYVLLRGRPLIVRLQCRVTDFGPRWGLEGSYADSVSDWQRETPAEESQPEVKAEAQREERAPNISPGDENDAYKLFLADFIAAVREGRNSDYEKFYYREADFNLAASEESPEATRERLLREHDYFIRRCDELNRALAGFAHLEIEEITAYGITAAMMSDLLPLMPGIRVFYNSAVIKVKLDGLRGFITLEGVALMQDGWRVGAIASFDLPQPPEPQR
jgi:hypothetical protein